MGIQTYVDDFAGLTARAGAEPSWLPPIRRAAFERFRALGFPTRRDEDWHFTSAAPIADAEFTPLRGEGSPEAGDVRLSDLEPFLFGGLESPRLVFLNGEFAPDLSTTTGLAPRVRLSRLAQAMKAEPSVVRTQLTAIADISRNAFAALNTALFTDGVFVHVPAGVALDRPLQILYVSTAEAAKGVDTRGRLSSPTRKRRRR